MDSQMEAMDSQTEEMDSQMERNGLRNPPNRAQWVNYNNCHWAYCHHHGWTKCHRCEQQEKKWSEQSEVKCNESNNEPQTYGEPFQKKARCKEHTITDDIFDFIGSLDDHHLTAASRIVKAATQYRQEKGRDKEHLVIVLVRTQISTSHTEDCQDDDMA